MKQLLCILLLGYLNTSDIAAQYNPANGNSKTPKFFDADTITPSSFEELLPLSSLVVTGRVDAVLPGRLSNPNNSNSVEHDTVFLVDKVIKGSSLDLQKSFKRVVISELGGQYQGQMILPSGESLFEPGERYVLFLWSDTRKGEPSVAGLPRYTVVGLWHGRFRSEKLGGVHASHKAMAGLHAHDSKSEADFVSSISSLIANNAALGK